jgi:hypothetical protein
VLVVRAISSVFPSSLSNPQESQQGKALVPFHPKAQAKKEKVFLSIERRYSHQKGVFNATKRKPTPSLTQHAHFLLLLLHQHKG